MVLDAVKLNALTQAAFPAALTEISTHAEGSTGRWEISHTIDPMSDAEAVRFTLLANTSAGTGLVSLMVECSAQKTSVGIHWNDYLGAEQAGPYLIKEVAMRLGSGRPETNGWVTSPDQTATWAGQPTTELVFGLMQNAKVAAQVTPYNSSPKTASFDTSGLQALIEANKAVCGVINAATVKSNNPSLIPSRTLTGWVRWNGESGSINGQSQWAHFDQSTRGRNILFAGCEIKTTVSVPCKVTFIAEGEQIINFISAGSY